MNNDVTRRDWNFVAVHESEQIVGRRERYKKEKVKTFDVFYIYIGYDHKHDCRYFWSCMTPSTNVNDERKKKEREGWWSVW